ncbi:MAG: hypothetical protein WBE93_27880, partial [Pseudolabrys sp.]
ACLIQGEDFGWSDLVLPLAATLVCVALIVGFAARLPDFQQKPTLRLSSGRERRPPVAQSLRTN